MALWGHCRDDYSSPCLDHHLITNGSLALSDSLTAVCKTLHGDNRLIDTFLSLYYGRLHSRVETARTSVPPHLPRNATAEPAVKTESFC
jgi:hypothetical protein